MGTVRLVEPTANRCGEAATWCAAENALYWCDIGRFLIHRYDEAGASVKSWEFPEAVVALAPTTRQDTMLVALGSRLVLWRPKDHSIEPLPVTLPGYPDVRFNDGRADPQGRFWVGSMENNILENGDLDFEVESNWTTPGLGTLFRVEASGEKTAMRSQIGISNTVCWSPDGGTFYFGDTTANEIRAYDFDGSTGAIGNERLFFAGFERGRPDGSIVDSEGYLWNCRFGGGCVVRVSPAGEIDRIVEMPCTDVTTCTFGGADLKTLYVTTAMMRLHKGERLAGALFALDNDIAGLPERSFRLAD